MKNVFIKTFSIFFSFLLLLNCFVYIPVSAKSTTKGDLGTGVTWSYNTETKTLSLTGKGEIPFYDIQSNIPWWDYRNDIEEIFIEEGITTVYSFVKLSKLKSVSLPSTVTDIGGSAFYYCTALETVNLSKNINYISDIAFLGCSSLLHFTIEGDLNGRGNAFVGYGGDKIINGSGKGYFVRDGVLFSNYDEYLSGDGYFKKVNHNRLELYPYGRTATSYTIPSNTMSIMQDAFSSVKHLETIVIPASVRQLASISFRNLGEEHEHPLMLVFQHDSLPTDMSYSTSRNLLKGSKIVVKNNDLKEKLEENASYFFYTSNGIQTATIETLSTPTTSLQLNQTNLSLKINETSVIEPTQTPCNTTDSISFTSSNNSVASFDKYGCGRITATGVGTAILTVTSGNISAHCEVTVTCDHEKTHMSNATSATCKKSGYTGDVVCDVCEIVITKGSVIEPSAHNYVEDPSKEATCTEHGYIGATRCSDCGRYKSFRKTVMATGHAFDDGVITKAATSEEKGIKTYTCTKCGETKTETIAKLVSNKNIVVQVTSTQSCSCSAGHEWNKWKVVKAATCSTTGKKVKTCANCGEFKTEKIVKTAHKTKTVGKKAATYFAKGSTGKKVCTVCNKTVSKAKILTKKTLRKPNITVKSGQNQITVKYKKVSGATGFQVRYRQSGKKKWTVKTYSSKKTVSTVIKSLKKGKKYNVQVRAMVKKGSKKAYSKWSTTKTVKVK